MPKITYALILPLLALGCSSSTSEDTTGDATSDTTNGDTTGDTTDTTDTTDTGDGDGDGDGDGATGDGDGTTGDGDGCSDSCADLSSAAPPSTEDVFIERIDTTTGDVTVRNTGTAAVDLSSWWVCNGPGEYALIGFGTADPGMTATFTAAITFDAAAGAMGLYSGPTFDDPTQMRAFVQWGAAGSPREGEAATAGLWTAGEFVDACTGHDQYVAIGATNSAVGYRSELPSCAP
jgi:hypothetical protein